MYTKEELKSYISDGQIYLEDDTIYIGESLSKKAFIKSMKELYGKEDFGEYRKSTQKSKSKRRKSK